MVFPGRSESPPEDFTDIDDSRSGVRLARPVNLEPGENIADFEVIRQIGQGGMGTVYLCRRINRDFEQQVAVKVLSAPVSRSSTELVRERQILARLTHPNIASLTDGGILESGSHYVVMEYVEGMPFTEYADHHDLGVTDRLHLVLQLCSALEHAHRNLIVHCDIKPENVLVTEDETVKLLDFGVAFLAHQGPSNDSTSPACTPRYASPEQQAGQPLNVTSDVYSLGVLTRELLASAPRWPTLMSRTDFDCVLAKATAENPHNRYANVSDFRHDIEAVRDRRPVTGRQSNLSYRLTRFIRRFPVETGLVGIVFAVAIAAATMLIKKNEQLARERDAAVIMQNRAEQSLNVLTDAMSFANPEAADAREISGAYILRSMVRSVNDAREMDAATRGYLNLHLADVHISLADHEGALELLASLPPAVEVSDKTLALKLLAGTDVNDSRVPEWLEEARSRQGGPLLWFAIGRVLAVGGDPGEALTWLLRAHGEETEGVLAHRIARQIVDAHMLQGNLQEALAFLTESLAVDTNPAIRADALHSMAALLLRAEKAEQAASTGQQAVSTLSDVYGDAHPATLAAKITLASALISSGLNTDGIRKLEETVEAADRVLGNHRQTALAHYQLGRALLGKDRSRAKSHIATAVRVAADALGADHPASATFRETLAAELWRDGDLEAAANHYKQALATHTATQNAQRESWVRLYYGDVLHSAGRHDEAQVQYRACRKLAEDLGDERLLAELNEQVRQPSS